MHTHICICMHMYLYTYIHSIHTTSHVNAGATTDSRLRLPSVRVHSFIYDFPHTLSLTHSHTHCDSFGSFNSKLQRSESISLLTLFSSSNLTLHFAFLFWGHFQVWLHSLLTEMRRRLDLRMRQSCTYSYTQTFTHQLHQRCSYMQPRP